MIKATTHGRAGIIGNPTDGYGGSLVSCSIKNHAEVLIREDKELMIENRFGQTVLRWENDFANQGDYFDIVRCVLRFLKLYDLKARITIRSNIPLQAGLSGSTAILSSVLAGLLAFTGQTCNRYQLAEMNRAIELTYLKCQCGYQDAYMTTFGGLNFLDLRGKEYYREWEQEAYGVVESLTPYVERLPFVIAHTGIKHHSGQFHRPLRERWLEGDPALVNGYQEIAAIAREGKKALIQQNWPELAYLMNKNHQIQDSLCDSGEQNRRMIDTALKHGAMAAKLAGAGGGGTIIVLTLEPEKLIHELKAAGAEEFVELHPAAAGVTTEYINENQEYVAATNS
jgi:galactokinase/mevalonate kinase-like predicted kinase